MPTFNTWSQIENHVLIIMQKEIMKFAEEVKLKLQDELKTKFYGRAGYDADSSGTDYYTRTWELLECISVRPLKRVGNEITTEVFYDTDKMNTYPSDGHEWSKHESITTGTDVRLMIPFWIEFSQNSPLYSWEGFHIVGNVTEELISSRALLKHFSSALRLKGFKVI